MSNKLFKSFIIMSIFGLFLLGLMEISLRILGYEPFRPITTRVQPKGYEFDAKLGWKLVPGSYEVGPFNDRDGMISLSIKKDTGRVTRTNNNGLSEEQITFIGGSFMMGHGLNDDQTMAWKLQTRYPHMDIRNLAVSGYGTLQSLMVLENEIENGNQPKCVIYGAFQHHAFRNVAQGDWLMELHKKIPYVILQNDSTFKRMGLIGMHQLRLKKRLASAYLAEKALNRILSYRRVKDAKKLSYLLIQEMHRICMENEIAFYVAPLQYKAKEMNDLVHFLDKKGINFIDCNVPLTLDNIIKDDGHPGESVNDIWVERIANQLTLDKIILEE